MKTKIFKSVLLLVVIFVSFVLLNISLGAVDHFYAVSATDQLEGDSAYYLMEIQSELTMLVKVVFLSLISFTIFMGYKVWEKKSA